MFNNVARMVVTEIAITFDSWYIHNIAVTEDGPMREKIVMLQERKKCVRRVLIKKPMLF
jgi:hypothetical protein